MERALVLDARGGELRLGVSDVSDVGREPRGDIRISAGAREAGLGVERPLQAVFEPLLQLAHHVHQLDRGARGEQVVAAGARGGERVAQRGLGGRGRAGAGACLAEQEQRGGARRLVVE
ncbi:MAG: hypothetical protein ACTHU0_09275 [Kofleriaceae bacterium]